MKKNRIISALTATALLFAGACSNDTLEPGNNVGGLLTPGEGSGGVFLSVDFEMPNGQGTRSATSTTNPNNPGGTTSDGGTEIGQDYENFVSSALIVLAATEAKPEAQIQKYGFIVAGEVPGSRIATASSNSEQNPNKHYRATAQLQKENLNTLYSTYGDGNVPEVYVFVFCNPTTDLLNMFDAANTQFGSADWINATCEVIQTTNAAEGKNIGIWGSNSFLMNNVHLASRELPQNLLDWENFSSVEKPFHLSGKNTITGSADRDVDNETNRGAVLVERSVARFDFKDGSKNDNTYKVLMNMNEEGDFDNAQPVVDVQIQKMCLVNMSNKFYYLPRTSENGLDADSELCGIELKWTRNSNGTYYGGNYVVGPYASVFGGNAVMEGFDRYLNFPFFENNGSFNNEAMSSDRWDVVKVSDVLKNTEDKYTDGEGGYRIWRYVTENVIPVNQNKQLNGISTGVVFKGQLLGNPNVTTNPTDYYEEDWNKGNLVNLAKCLNGETFTYNGVDHVLKGNSYDDPILYYFSGHLYMGWRHIRQAAIQAAVTINAAGEMEINRSNSLYKAVFGDGPIPTYTTKDNDGKDVVNHMVYVDPNPEITDPKEKNKEINDPMWEAALANTAGEEYTAYLDSPNYAWSVWALGDKEVGDDSTGANTPEPLKKMREKVTAAGITIYQSSVDEGKPGYYCYYYYWNRHNDNGLNGSMGPMEFCVVRNNVYKLMISSIARLGHPRIPENDPENPTPDDPDESDEIYLDVKMEIAPWVVRVNGIQF